LLFLHGIFDERRNDLQLLQREACCFGIAARRLRRLTDQKQDQAREANEEKASKHSESLCHWYSRCGSGLESHSVEVVLCAHIFCWLWLCHVRESNQLFEPGYEAGGELPGNVLRFNERTNFDVVVVDHTVRASLQPVNRFL